MNHLIHRPVMRWLAPLFAALVFITAGSVVSAITSAAQADLAPRSAAQLLVDVQQARLSGLSGTVVQHADLGIPALPGVSGDSTELSSLVSGSHTLRLWYAGPERIRLALLGQFGESDLIRNGTDAWMWSSSQKSATHWTLPADVSGHPASTPADPTSAATTPQQAADQALKAITPTTSVTTNGTATVAGRAAYLLTLQPRSANSLVDSVQIAIDGKTHVPTRVQVFAKGTNSPAFSVGFTSFNPGTPSSSVFGFNPPPNTKVTEKSLTSSTGADAVHKAQNKVSGHTGASTEPTVIGSGWTAVVIATAPSGLATDQTTKPGKDTSTMGALLTKLPKVSGTWGSGRLLQGTLFSVLLTDDGHVVAGAVPPAQLYDALAAR
jgi:outer membrane lipoprotein-sorting protein